MKGEREECYLEGDQLATWWSSSTGTLTALPSTLSHQLISQGKSHVSEFRETGI